MKRKLLVVVVAFIVGSAQPLSLFGPDDSRWEPPQQPKRSYEVAPGDTQQKIMAKTQRSWAAISELNQDGGIHLKPGSIIWVPVNP